MYDFTGEFVKASVDVADSIGLNLVMSQNAGKGVQVMVVALGWATATLLMFHRIPSELEPRALSLTESTSRRAWIPASVWSIISTHLPGPTWSHATTHTTLSCQRYSYWCSLVLRDLCHGDLCPPLYPGQHCWPSAPWPVCPCCQHALLGLVSQTFTYPFPASRFQ